MRHSAPGNRKTRKTGVEELRVEELEQEECCFIIPGDTEQSARYDVCRTVTRRAERLARRLHNREGIANGRVMVYLNRLSDLLWILARGAEPRSTEFGS